MEATLAPNDLLELELEGTPNRPPLCSRFEGVEGDVAWVAAPQIDGKPFLPDLGTVVRVAWRGGDGVYWFAGEVLARRVVPVPLVGIRCPEAVTHDQRRAFVRVDVWGIPQTVVVDGGGARKASVEAVLANLSASGARIWLREKAPVGTRLRLRLPQLPDGSPIELDGELVWLAERPRARLRPFEAGIRFLDLGPRESRRLTRYVSSQQAQLIRKGLLGQ